MGNRFTSARLTDTIHIELTNDAMPCSALCDATCAICHDRFDPAGFALENFDALGRWRTEVAGQPIDASARFPGGPAFSGPAGLKQVVLADKALLVRNLTERMLAFALGRDLEITDRPVVKQICDALAKDNYRASTLVYEITRSLPFTHRRPEKAEKTAENL